MSNNPRISSNQPLSSGIRKLQGDSLSTCFNQFITRDPACRTLLDKIRHPKQSDIGTLGDTKHIAIHFDKTLVNKFNDFINKKANKHEIDQNELDDWRNLSPQEKEHKLKQLISNFNNYTTNNKLKYPGGIHLLD